MYLKTVYLKVYGYLVECQNVTKSVSQEVTATGGSPIARFFGTAGKNRVTGKNRVIGELLSYSLL